MADQPNSGTKPVTVERDGDIILVLSRMCFEGFTVLKCYAAYVCSYLASPRDSLSVPFSTVWTASTMKIKQIVYPETPVNYQHTPPNLSKEWIPQLHSGGILKSRTMYFSTNFTIDNKKSKGMNVHSKRFMIHLLFNCNWVFTRWQYTFTHKQYVEQHK